jgi:hypothetical protein
MSISPAVNHIPLPSTNISSPERYPPAKQPGVGIAQYRLAKAAES